MTDLAIPRALAWPGLYDVPAGPRTTLSAAVVRRILGEAARRLGVTVQHAGAGAGAGAARGRAGAVLVLHRPEEFYARVGRHGLIGFGESFMTGAWGSPDLGRLLTVMAGEIGTLVPERLQRWRRWYVARHPRAHRNSLGNSTQNIAHHYDLSNELFETFLDRTLTYSSALFDAPLAPAGDSARAAAGGPRVLVAAPPRGAGRADLATAQGRKIDRLLDVTGVGPGGRVLEIGTGWGELAIRAARRGAEVRSVTLSREQQALARERIAAAGLADRVSVELRDYRQVAGEYDAVLSVEMIEAVGYEYLPEYFATVRRLLAPGGRAGIQAITMPHHRMLATLGTFTWINKYIFPGGFLPSTELLTDCIAGAGLTLAERLSFGSHYAETLRLWDGAFCAADVASLGFDETFRRMWHFYLQYSRAGFASGYLDVQQLLLERRR